MLDTRSGSFYLSFIHFCHFADKMNKVAAAAAALGDDKLLAVPNKVCFLLLSSFLSFPFSNQVTDTSCLPLYQMVESEMGTAAAAARLFCQ